MTRFPELTPPDPRSTCHIVFDLNDGARYAQKLAKAIEATGRKVAPLLLNSPFVHQEGLQFDVLILIGTESALKPEAPVVQVLDRAREAGVKSLGLFARSRLSSRQIPQALDYFEVYVDEDDGALQRGIPSLSTVNRVEGSLHGFDVANRGGM